jgi:hypothetical protein
MKRLKQRFGLSEPSNTLEQLCSHNIGSGSRKGAASNLIEGYESLRVSTFVNEFVDDI